MFRCILFFLIALTAACNSSRHENVELIPHGLDGSGALCAEFVNVHNRIENKNISWFYGRIEKVEAFTGRFLSRDETYSRVYSTEPCALKIYPAVQVFVRVEKASWDLEETGDLIPLSIDYLGLALHYIHVSLAANQRDLIWEMGETRYFPTGARIGAYGTFDPEGFFRTWVRSLYGVDDEGIIYDHRLGDCEVGELNGFNVHEIIESSRRISGGVPPVIDKGWPFASECRQDEESAE